MAGGASAWLHAGRGGGLPARYELKFVIPEPLVGRVVDFARAYCDSDPHGPEGAPYTITTLYLDGPGLPLWWQKKQLRWDRVKARVRTYGARADGPVFLELKRRYGDVVSKTRLRVPPEAWPALVDEPTTGRGPSDRLEPPGQGGFLDDFRLQCALWRLRPVVAVRYDREALVGRFDRGLRVTFDRAVRWRRVDRAEIPVEEDGFLPLVFGAGVWTPDPRVVLELKFTWAFPRWMQDLVERFDLDRGSFSKYGRAMDQALGEASECDPSAWGSTVGGRWTTS